MAENLRQLMQDHANERGITSRELEKKLAEKGIRLSYKTIDRILNPFHDTAPNLDSLDALARFFKLDTFYLLARRQMLQGSETRSPETPGAHSSAGEIPSGKKRSGR